MRRSNGNTATFIGMALAAFIVIGGIGTSAFIQRTLEDKTITVTEKERITSFSSSDGTTKTTIENFVYSDEEVYSVKDSLWNWHFRAGTVYAKIPETGTCNVTLSGMRIGFFSMNQNIIAADCQKMP